MGLVALSLGGNFTGAVERNILYLDKEDTRPLLGIGIELYKVFGSETVSLISWFEFEVVSVVEVDAGFAVAGHSSFSYQ